MYMVLYDTEDANEENSLLASFHEQHTLSHITSGVLYEIYWMSDIFLPSSGVKVYWIKLNIKLSVCAH